MPSECGHICRVAVGEGPYKRGTTVLLELQSLFIDSLVHILIPPPCFFLVVCSFPVVCPKTLLVVSNSVSSWFHSLMSLTFCSTFEANILFSSRSFSLHHLNYCFVLRGLMILLVCIQISIVRSLCCASILSSGITSQSYTLLMLLHRNNH